MKQKIPYQIVLTGTALVLLAGCASQKNVGEKKMTVNPAPYILTPDSNYNATIDVMFHVPEHYFSKRSRLVITPQLISGNEVINEYDPLVLDAPIYSKKMQRLEVLEGYTDTIGVSAQKADRTKSYDLPYKKRIALTADAVTDGRLIAVVSTDGCGSCTGIDTLDVALVSNPVSLMKNVKEELQLSWIEPKFVIRPKIREGRGVANLQFTINKSDINLTMGNNRKEMENMLHILEPILQDSLATLSEIKITGMASADGSLPFNTTLARNRAASAKQWIIQQLSIKSHVQRHISVDSRPEGWEPVLAAMTADGNTDSLAVKEILTRQAGKNDDVQERYIRRLPCWNNIKTKYLQKNRVVEYVYAYTLKSFTTNDELRRMYRQRPDAFNEEELLRVATLSTTDNEKKEVYETILRYFPQSQIAANNLAVLHLRVGHTAEAQQILNRLTNYSPEALNTLAASYVYANNYEKAVELLQAATLPEARYNLGLLKAKQRKLSEAYKLLRPFADLNSAIVALSVNQNNEAAKVLSSLKDKSPIAEYVRSLTGARLQQDTFFYQHIENACQDGALRQRAATEADFYRYREADAFKNLIK